MGLKESLEKSYRKYGPLYPILVDRDGNVIDGFHRLKIDKNWPKFQLEWADTPLKKEIAALISNVYRRDIHSAEITNRLNRIAEILLKEGVPKGKICEKIADLTGASLSWVRKYIGQEYKSESHVESIKKRWEKPSEIWEEAGNHLLVGPVETRRGSNVVTEKLEIPLPIDNVWFALEERPRGFGSPCFHGNTPPFIAINVVLKYTKAGDTVLDPMAGSGTLVDVCKYFNRNIIAYDLNPIRKDIYRGDAEKINLEKKVDLIFAHWPYWNMVKYSKDPEDLSNLNYKDFLEKSERIIANLVNFLRKNGYFAILIGDRRKGRRIYDLSADISKIGQKYMLLYDKIIWVGEKQRSYIAKDKTLNEWRARNYRFHLLKFDTLLIFKKC